MRPLVSVVVPTYQGAAALVRTLESVLSQTLEDLEVVLADDGSTDASPTIGAAFAARDSRVRLTSADHNLGAVANWNRAVQAAEGQFIKVMGQDDVLGRRCLQRSVERLRAHPEAGAVVVGRNVIDERGRTILRARRPLRGVEGTVSAERALPLVVGSGTNVIGEPVTVLLRRAVVEAVGPFSADLPYVVDLDYWFRALTVAPMVVAPETLCSFRVSAQSWSVALAAQQGEQMCALFARVQDERPDLVSAALLRRGCLRARALARARRMVYAGLRARASAEALARRAGLGSPAGTTDDDAGGGGAAT